MNTDAMKSLLCVLVMVSCACAGAAENQGREAMPVNAVNIVPFALPNTPANEVWFEEPRDITLVRVDFQGAAPADIGVSYLQKTWPKTRPEQRIREMYPASFGWTHQDDWLNGEWKKAAVSLEKDGERRVWIRFPGLSAEFPDAADYDVTYRRTLALRVDAPEPDIAEIAVFTASTSQSSRLRVELDAGIPTSSKTLRFEGYNAYLEAIDAAKGVSVATDAVTLAGGDKRQFALTVRHLRPAHIFSGDDGLLTFFTDQDAFTISITNLEEQGPIWFPDAGIYIAREDDPTSFAEYQARNAGAKTLAKRVLDRSEQCLAGALYGQPRPHSVSYNLGCSHARQRFRLEPNGDLLLEKRNVTWVEGKDTGRFKNTGTARFLFGLEDWSIFARYPDPEPVLAYNLHARRLGLAVEQESFAVPLLTPIDTGAWAGDDPIVGMVRFRFRNESAAPLRAEFPVRYTQESSRIHDRLFPCGPLDELRIDKDGLLGKFDGNDVLRCAVQTTMTISANGPVALFTQELMPGETCDLVLKIPYIALESTEERAALTALDFDQCHQAVTTYWRRESGRGAQLKTPELQLAALHASHLTHVEVTDFEMPDGSGLINTSVGTSTYGNYSNESCMIVHELDQRGLWQEARPRLELWLKYQGTVPQPGNFTDYNGMFYGAGGFECGAYNQHHGWVLWCLCEHYFFTRDDDWFRGVADKVIAGADWIFRQRKNTMTDLPHSRGWERGFLPAGSLEDVTDFYYWLSTNALTWRGADAAARALETLGHADAARVRNEADAYKADLIAGFETMRQHAPLVRLRDGRWVPHYPSRLYRRGREMGWIRETLEGSVYLLISGLYDSNSPQAGWILDDFQDNRYPSPPFGYLIPEFDHTWFDRAGLSIQPNLLAGLMPYLDRDEPELYLWMFYNCWAACYREEINAMIEHPMPVLGYSNAAHFKTSDEANAVSWLRAMFVYENPNLLHLGRAIPRAWFNQPESFEARDVATHFGKAGVQFHADNANKKLRATVYLDIAKKPAQILVRFRTPAGQELKTARMDGKPAKIADAKRGDIDLTGKNGVLNIEAEY